MHVNINTPALLNESVDITDSAAEAVRMSFNPSTRKRVDRLKALAAAFLSECEAVTTEMPESGRELAVAKTQMQTASMWAVLGATKGARDDAPPAEG